MRGAPDDGRPGGAVARSGDLALVRSLWLLVLAQFLTTLPVTATGIFLPAIAADLGRSAALVGGLRSLGGVAALACGVLAAPLIDRIARARTIAGGMALLAVAAFLAARGTVASLTLFYVLAGAAGAIYQPALQAAAADGRDAPAGARAAALLTACGALAPMLAGPLLAAPAGWWGWRGDFLAMGTGALLIALLAGARLGHRPPAGVDRPAYRAAFRLVAAAPGALPLLLGATLRATLQFAWLSYLAAYLVARFAASTGAVAATWTMGGTSVFLGNLLVGRLIAASKPGDWRTAERLLPVILLVQAVLTPLGLLVPSLPLAMVVAGLTAGTHGSSIAAIISLLVRRYAPLRGAVLGLNASGLNLGLFAGAALGGVALGAGGYPGLIAALVALSAATIAVTTWAVRRAGPEARPATAGAAD